MSSTNDTSPAAANATWRVRPELHALSSDLLHSCSRSLRKFVRKRMRDTSLSKTLQNISSECQCTEQDLDYCKSVYKNHKTVRTIPLQDKTKATFLGFTDSFYPRDAMLARVIEIAMSVRLSVRPSRAGIVSK